MCTLRYLVVTVVVDIVDDDAAGDDDDDDTVANDDDDDDDDVIADDVVVVESVSVDLRSIDIVWRRSINSMAIQLPAPRSVVGKRRYKLATVEIISVTAK